MFPEEVRKLKTVKRDIEKGEDYTIFTFRTNNAMKRVERRLREQKIYVYTKKEVKDRILILAKDFDKCKFTPKEWKSIVNCSSTC